jgi:hypothetical protein
MLVQWGMGSGRYREVDPDPYLYYTRKKYATDNIHRGEKAATPCDADRVRAAAISLIKVMLSI